MSESRMHKSSNLFPKMFKMVSFFMIVCLCSFFGCIQFFAPSAPNLINPDKGGASTSTPFQEFIYTMMNFKNIDTNFKIGVDNENLSLFAEGRLIYDVNGSMLADVDLVYNGQSFNVDVKMLEVEEAVRAASVEETSAKKQMLYLKVTPKDSDDVKTYKLDLSSQSANLDLSNVLQLVMQNIDTSFVDNILDYIELDLDDENFSIDKYIEKMLKKQEPVEGGGYVFELEIKALKAQILCDENFNIKRIVLKDVVIDGNALTFNVNVNSMNGNNISVDYTETGEEVDLSGLMTYSAYAQNLFENNDFVCADVNLSLAEESYAAKVYVDQSEGLKVKLETELEVKDEKEESSKLGVMLGYSKEVVFAQIGGLNFKFAVADFDRAKTEIDKLLTTAFGKTTTQLVNELLEKYFGKLDEMDVSQTVLGVLKEVFASVDSALEYLPQSVNMTENNFEMLWKNGLTVSMSQNENQLTAIYADFEIVDTANTLGNVNVAIEFEVLEQGFDIEGNFFDVAAFSPLCQLAEEVLKNKKLGGEFEVVLEGNLLAGDFAVNFDEENLFMQVNMSAIDENVSLYIHNRAVWLVVGEVVVSGNLENLDAYLQKIDAVFGTTFAGILNPVKDKKEIAKTIFDILNKLSIGTAEEKFAVISYISAYVGLEVVDESVVLTFGQNEVDFGTITIYATDKTVSLPTATDEMTDVLEKVQNVYEYVLSKQFAFSFDLEVENITLSGLAQLDFKNNLFEISGVEIGQQILNVRYESGVAYIDYAGNKVKVNVDSAIAVYDIVAKIVKANLKEENADDIENAGKTENVEVAEVGSDNVDGELKGNAKFDNAKMLSQVFVAIFGEDLSANTVSEILSKLSVKVAGDLDALKLNVKANTQKPIVADVTIDFAENELSKCNVSLKRDETDEAAFARLEAEKKTFGIEALSDLQKAEYYDILSAQSGTATLTYTYKHILENGTEVEESVDLLVDVKLDIQKLYLELSTNFMGIDVKVLLKNEVVYVKVGEFWFNCSLNEAKELFDYVVKLFNISLDEKTDFVKTFDIEKFIKTLDLNVLDVLAVDGLTFNIYGDGLSVGYALRKDLSLTANLQAQQELDQIDSPVDSQKIETLLPKIKNMLDYVQRGLFGFDFEVNYNGLDVSGTFKYDKVNEIYEITSMKIFGENLTIRVQGNVLYITFGNMKIKTVLQANGENGKVNIASVAGKLLNDEFGVDLQFGVFEEILTILHDFTLKDYLQKLKVDLSGTIDDMQISLSKLNDTEDNLSKLLSATVLFKDDMLHKVTDLNVRGVLKGNILLLSVEDSTIPPFNEKDYENYATNFMEGLMSSLQVEETIYAFSSDMAIRYSKNTFYGKLTAMLVKDKTSGKYTPSVSLYTTSLGLNTFIYLIGQTVYIDINGLQVAADLNENTIDEVMAFVNENFANLLPKTEETVAGIDETSDEVDNTNPVQSAVEAFKVVIPALDQIRGQWIKTEGVIDGIEFKTADMLKYKEDAWFYDIVLQAFGAKHENTIIPTKLILGTNIHDASTKYDEEGNVLVEDYSKFFLDCEEKDVTGKLHLAVYLTNLQTAIDKQLLGQIFGSEDNFQTITSLRSNDKGGTTKTEDYNSYKTLLDFVETVYNYGTSLHFNVNMNGTVTALAADENNKISQTALSAKNILVAVDDLPPTDTMIDAGGTGAVTQTAETDEKSDDLFGGLFNGKSLNVQANKFTIDNKEKSVSDSDFALQARHQIDLLYGSERDGFYLTYSHDNYADGDSSTENIGKHSLKARIANANLSNIISLLTGFMNINLGEAQMEQWSLNRNTTDFRFIRTLMNMQEKADSDVDEILGSVTEMAKMIDSIRLSKVENENKLFDTLLTIKLNLSDLNMDENGNVDANVNYTAEVVILMSEELVKDENDTAVLDENGQPKVERKFKQIQLHNVVFGGNVIDLTIGFDDYDYSKVDYTEPNEEGDVYVASDANFDYDTSDHINFSGISNLVDYAVATINAREFNYSGSAVINLGKGQEITIGINLYAKIDPVSGLYLLAELTPEGNGIGDAVLEGRNRNSIIEYKNNQIVVINRVNKLDWFTYKDFYNKVVCSSADFANNWKNVVYTALCLNGLGKTAINIALDIIKFPKISIEQLLLNFVASGDTFDLVMDGKHLTGSNDSDEFMISLAAGSATKVEVTNQELLKKYNNTDENGNLLSYTKEHKFIDSIKVDKDNKPLKVSIVTVSFELNSNADAYTFGSYSSDGITLGGLNIRSNNAYRLDYLSSIGNVVA